MKKKLTGNWLDVKLGELSEIRSGGTPSRSKKKYFEGDVPWVKSGELNFNTISDTEEKITKEALDNSSAKIFPKGTLLIALYGATVGKLAFLGINAATNQAVASIIPVQELDNKYIYWFLFSYRDKLLKERIGGAQPNISQSILKEVNLPLPPLPEQHRIVNKIEELFSELDKGIENLRKAKEQIKTYRQAVLAAAFSGKLTGELRVENSELRIGENDPLLVRQMLKAAEPRVEYGKDSLPEGWKWVKLGEHIESMKNGLYKPAEYYSDNGIPCLRMYNIQNGKIEWYDIKRMIITEEELEEYKLLEDDLLVNRVNSRELVGKTARILKSMELSVYESKNIRVRLMPSLSSSYVNYWFIFYGNKYFDKNTQQTVGMASINQSQTANMEIPITDLSKQNEVVSEIEWRFSVADKLEQTIDENLNKAELLKQSILKQAFEGKLV